MLSGSITYRKPERDYNYRVIAQDSPSIFSMTISSGDFIAQKMEVGTDVNDDHPNILDSRRVDISMADVSVESVAISNGKKKIKEINTDLFCRLGALIRYVKVNCTTKNELGYTGLKLASGEFDVSPSSDYVINYPKSDRVLAKVTLTYGDISDFEMITDDFIVEMHENSGINYLFTKVNNQTGIKLGLKIFDEEYLGFPLYMEKVPASTITGVYEKLEDIIKAHPEKELSWLLDMQYSVVNDDNLEEVCKYIREWNGYVYYDTETTGLNINFKSRTGQADQLVGVVLSVKYGESFYFPLQMKAIDNLCNGDHFYVMEHYMRPILEGKEIVAHNMTFDWKVAYIYNINANIVHDTLLMIMLTLGAERDNYPLGLKDNAKLILHRDSLELSDLLVDGDWGDNDIKFWDLPYELVKLYACADTDNTNGLLQYFLKTNLLEKYNAKKVYEIEVAFAYAVAYQEFYGHRIDVHKIDETRKKIKENIDDLMKKMVEIVGHDFNPNSPKQLLSILYTELGIPEQISRKTGRPTTDKETLQKLAEITDIEDNIKYPFCALLQKYRENEGVRKIIDKFPELATKDGFLFPSILQCGASTGRVSINTPNYQSYNDPVKKTVVPRENYWMFDTDYSSVEYRVLGNMVGNKSIIHRFEDPDFDYHTYQAAHMYNVPYSAVTKKLRKAAKGINFGLPYGMGDESLGVRVFGEATPENTRKAANLRSAYFKGQEDIRDWFEQHRSKGVNEGFTETYFGRRRYYNKNKFSVGAIRRQAGNQVIQGCICGDTLIETKDYGILPICDLEGYSGPVWNGSTWTNGDVLYSGKKRKCIITFTNGQKFICSPIHRFYIEPDTVTCVPDINPHWQEDMHNDGFMGGYFVRCEDLKVGQVIKINTKSDLVVNKYGNHIHTIECTQVVDSNSEIQSYGMTVYKTVKDIPCVIVQSIEITDEYIDMFDVCNTDCGYYVADGIITHNTAADIYKTAVGRVFKRICKEGWLGKVLFTGFIHDELLGEVSNDINPAIWLKILREEFEVKITNTDGSKWCPLYMGFGYGRNWYEAKYAELPIKLQWEIVEKYGDTGFPNWRGNISDICDNIPNILKDFSIRDITNQLLAPESQGKEIKPALNTELLDCVKDDAKNYKKYIDLNKRLPEDELYNTYHISGFIYDNSNGTIVKEVTPSKDTQEAITQFCKFHNVDRSKINVLSIEEYTGAGVNTDNFDPDDIEEDTSDKNRLLEIINYKIQAFGMHVDITEKVVYMRFMEVNKENLQVFLNYLKNNFISTEASNDSYKLVFRDFSAKVDRPTPYYIPSAKINDLQKFCIFFMKKVGLA